MTFGELDLSGYNPLGHAHYFKFQINELYYTIKYRQKSLSFDVSYTEMNYNHSSGS